MRYRKSVKLSKGVKLNLSKSGVSMTTGVRGFSFTMGTNGTYVNAGIPGSGLSTRKKVGSGASCFSPDSRDYIAYRINMDDDGSVSIYHGGSKITDETIISKIKRTPEFKSEKARLDAQRRENVSEQVELFNRCVDELIQISSKSEVVTSESDIKKLLAEAEPDRYEKNVFKKLPPSKEEIRARLEAEAQVFCSSLAFWTIKKKKEQYINSRIEQQYEEEFCKWQQEKETFEAEEDLTCRRRNAEFTVKYKQRCDRLNHILCGDSDFVGREIDSWLAGIELPLDFSVQYDYNERQKALFIDLDLPEIESLPDEAATQTASGVLKMKKKTQMCLRQDYAQCVFGLAIYFASHLFNVSTAIRSILISAYTQRRGKNGDLVDDYVYSIIFCRDKFEHVNLASVPPVEFCMQFKNRSNLTKTSILRTIIPFSKDDVDYAIS